MFYQWNKTHITHWYHPHCEWYWYAQTMFHFCSCYNFTIWLLKTLSGKVELLKISNFSFVNELFMRIKFYLQDVNFLNPFPHKDAFLHLCSRQLFENMETKEEIAQNKQFLLLSPCFRLYSIIVLSFKGSSQFFLGYVFEVDCCRIFACGKGLKQTSTYHLLY